MNPYATWFTRTVYTGIAVNMIFVVLLLATPEFLFNLLHMTTPSPIIWARAAAILLLEISIIYVPVAQDPFRYPIISWMTIFVTRGGGASFFILAVLLFNQQLGFLSIALTDTFFGSLEAFLLYRAMQTRGAINAST
ncbi:hypothetical protein [Acaryochloris sp. IP29b_bin.137]|uniref:hypothetical protein n=1 Tax=Acaryochloris sp. IP29b_bin.137 TaxID=2969217 RepID=UPI0026263079|nr:hypothetical protein [Acaryochloris sp. IP29b_bin.137]